MALTIDQLYDPSFISQLGPEYLCTGFMFDEETPMTTVEAQLSKEGFIPGIDTTEAEEAFAQMDKQVSPPPVPTTSGGNY